MKTNSDALYWFAEAGVVAPNGNVYFGESAENQNATGQVKVAVIRSTNGGTSWTTTFVDTSEQQPACTVPPSCPPTSWRRSSPLTVDPAGTLMAAYTLNTVAGAPKDLYVRTSTDVGVTWSARTEIGANTGDAGFPVIKSGTASGDFRVAWQDNRNGATSWNTWYRHTTNGGGTWGTQVRLSEASGAAPRTRTRTGIEFPYGDYFDLDVRTAPGRTS